MARPYPRSLHTIATLLLAALLAGCSSWPDIFEKSRAGDGAPARGMDASKIRDAVPRAEPRSRSGNPRKYKVLGKTYRVMQDSRGFSEQGVASWYGTKFHGQRTSSGETYDMYAMTAAHKTLPMNVHVKVTNLSNQRSTIVRVNDRGPFVKKRIIDLSYSAAKKLGVVGPGTAPVRVEALGYREPASASAPAHYRQPASYDVGPFMVQVGAFTVPENAHRLAVKLKERFGEAKVVEALVNGRQFYRVRAGRYDSLALATAALTDFTNSGYENCFVVASN